MSDTNGDENVQIYKMPDEGGEVEQLLKGFEDSQCFFHSFNKKGNKFVEAESEQIVYKL